MSAWRWWYRRTRAESCSRQSSRRRPTDAALASGGFERAAETPGHAFDVTRAEPGMDRQREAARRGVARDRGVVTAHIGVVPVCAVLPDEPRVVHTGIDAG